MTNLRTLGTLALLGLGTLIACSSSSGDDGNGGAVGGTSGSGSDASAASGGITGTGGSNDSGASGTGSGGSGDGGGSNGDASGGNTSSCLGQSLLADLGKTKMIVGGLVADATVTAAPIDLRYIYISGGLFDSATACTSCLSCTSGGTSCANENGASGCAWWGCWQYDKDPPGETVRTLDTAGEAASPAYVPMYTYYEIRSLNGGTEGATEVAAAKQVSIMQRYFADWRFLLQQVGQNVALLQIEPDFWGFAEEQNTDPHSLPAAVASADPTDCACV